MGGDRHGRDPGDTRREGAPEGLPVMFLVLLFSAEIPPARRERGPEMVAESSWWRSLCWMSCVGWPMLWVLRAHCRWDGALGASPRAPLRGDGAAQIWVQVLLFPSQPLNLLGCFLADTPAKPAFAINTPRSRCLSQRVWMDSRLFLRTFHFLNHLPCWVFPGLVALRRMGRVLRP